MKPSKNPSYQRLLSFLLALILILISIAPALIAPVSVYAAGSVGTLKAALVTLSMLMGVGNVDPASISYMNNNTVLSAPIEDFLGDDPTDYTAADLNAALSGNAGVARWTSAWANNAPSVKVAQEYITQAGGDPSGLDGLGEASAGENIISSVKFGYNNYKTTGNWDMKPSIGGQTVTDALNATAVMSAMSNYAYNFDQYMQYANNANLTQEERDELWDQGLVFADQNQIEDYLQNRNKTICNGADINTPTSAVNQMYYGGSYASSYNDSNNGVELYLNSGQYFIRYLCDFGASGILYSYRVVSRNPGTYKDTIISSGRRTSRTRTLGTMGNYYTFQVNSYNSPSNCITVAGTYSGNNAHLNAINAFFNDFENYDTENKSPSLIGSQGQLSGTATQDPTTNNYNYNINVNPTANYYTYNYRLPTDEEISTMISEAQTAINQGQTQEDIAEIFNQFAQQIRSERPVPTVPPTVPEQPTTEPKPTLTPEQEAVNKEIMASPNLKDKFPFCIPWDIYLMFTKWDSIEREAPHIEAELDLGPAGTHTIDIDFEDFNDAAALLRLLELIVFIVGLAVATRALIGAGGK